MMGTLRSESLCPYRRIQYRQQQLIHLQIQDITRLNRTKRALLISDVIKRKHQELDCH